MRSIKGALAALALAVAAGAGMAGALAPAPAWAEAWQEFRPGDGKFLALMPGQIVQTDQSYANGGAGKRLLVEAANDEAYLLEWTDYPAALANSKPPEQHLLEAQANAQKAFSTGRLLSEKRIAINQWPGRAFMIDLNDGMILQANHYWVGARLYQLIVVTAKAKSTNPVIKDYFGAFNILQR